MVPNPDNSEKPTMKKITLPEKAFSHKKIHTICGHRFQDGHIIVPNDVGDKISGLFKRFYGATVEDIPDVVEQEDDSQDNSGEASLTTSNTKSTETA